MVQRLFEADSRDGVFKIVVDHESRPHRIICYAFRNEDPILTDLPFCIIDCRGMDRDHLPKIVHMKLQVNLRDACALLDVDDALYKVFIEEFAASNLESVSHP